MVMTPARMLRCRLRSVRANTGFTSISRLQDYGTCIPSRLRAFRRAARLLGNLTPGNQPCYAHESGKPLYSEGGRKQMNELGGLGLNDLSPRAQNPGEPPPRAVGSPLPIGAGGKLPSPADPGDGARSSPIPPVGRALANTSDLPQSSGLQRAVRALRMALPYVQRILPLLDGNIATAVSNVLSPQQPSHPPAPPVD